MIEAIKRRRAAWAAVLLIPIAMGAAGLREATYPAASVKAITPGASVLDPTPRSIRADSAGTVIIGNWDGSTATLNVAAGEVIPFQPYKITGGTATVHGFYD